MEEHSKRRCIGIRVDLSRASPEHDISGHVSEEGSHEADKGGHVSGHEDGHKVDQGVSEHQVSQKVDGKVKGEYLSFSSFIFLRVVR